MDIRIIHLPPGTREMKREVVRQLAAKGQPNDLSHILYLCPTRHILKDWKRNILHSEAGRCYIPPQAFTLKQYARRLATSSGARMMPDNMRPVAISSLTGCGKGLAGIISETISELIAHMPGKGPEEIRETVAGTFVSLGLPEDALKRAETVIEAMSLYMSAISAMGLHDEASLYELAAASAAETHIKALVLDGFYEVTGSEMALISTLIERAESAVLTVPLSSPDDDRHYCYSRMIEERFDVRGVTVEQPSSIGMPEMVHTMPSQEEEIEEIARRIKADSHSGRVRELDRVLVVFPSLSTYRRPVERIFSRYGIPVNSASISQPLSRARPWSDLLGLLCAIAEGYPRLPFARSLASPFFSGIPDEIKEMAPSVSIGSGIVGGRKAWTAAMDKAGIVDVFKIVAPLEALIEGSTLQDCMDALVRVIGPLGFTPKEDCMEVLGAVAESFSTLAGIGSRNPGLQAFTDALWIALEGMSVGDDTAGVELASIYDVRGLEPDVLYIGGLRDGELPSRPEMDFVLPDSVRGRLGLVDLKRHMHLQGFIFKRLAMSSGSVRLSYPRMDGDKLYLPSMLISGITQSDEMLRLAYCAQERQVMEGGASIADHIRQINASPRGKSVSLRVTDAESYMKCPRRFYIDKILRLEPPKITEYEMDARDMGTLAHLVMQKLVPPERVSETELGRRAVAALDETLSQSGLDAYFSRLFKETFIEMLPHIYAHLDKLWDEGYSLMKAEQELVMETAEGIMLKGTADRIDIKHGTRSIQILDYKTGAAAISGGDIEKGSSLQLPLYASMLQEQGYTTERFGIYSLKDMHMKWVPSPQDRKKEHDADYFARTAKDHLKGILKGISSGSFRAEPAEESICRGCREMPFCPYHHAGGAG